ncbi:SpoIIE family protein phosphatase [Desulfonatronospira sp.]|uniref:SpoIIE family protein phosphatase n=1 Tax=Desulfonatronospira sp. TaxID=1962951 RepID=UPI0025BE0B9F|nr:SpoIIE family protein phosphatase [Desulfonatronospira sp.]
MQDNSRQYYKILLVDDSNQNIRILSTLLKKDYTVQSALDGEKALRIVFGADPPDLILLDILMPGIDGYEVCRRIKANPGTAGIPIIFVTGKSDSEDEAYGLSIGAVDYIAKPYHFPIIKARIKNHLELLQARRSAQAAHKELSRELEAMDELQRSILPAGGYSNRHLHVHGFYKPSGLAGGDYYDYLPLENECLRCVVADVSGHGARAAFIMSMVRSFFHFEYAAVIPLSKLVSNLNRQLMQTVGNMGDFVTLMALDIDPHKNSLEYINAGHCPAFFRDSRGLQEIEPTSVLLGLLEDEFPAAGMQCTGDWELFMYTDGFYECLVNGDKIFGYEAFRQLCFSSMSRGGFRIKDLPNEVAEAASGIVGFIDDLTGLYVQSGSGFQDGKGSGNGL